MRRRVITQSERKIVYAKTGGHCHFCGEQLVFGAKRGEKGRWNVDHVAPLAHGGRDFIENYLPICGTCNRLRWFFPSEKIRELFQYGTIAYREIRKKTKLGDKFYELYTMQLKRNIA